MHGMYLLIFPIALNHYLTLMLNSFNVFSSYLLLVKTGFLQNIFSLKDSR